jgi:ABC-type transport system involved in cytochrome c biogenesis ATPase subunit
MTRKIAMVSHQDNLKRSSQVNDDLQYWLTKTPQERLAAVTFLVKQNLRPSQKMDKSATSQKTFK